MTETTVPDDPKHRVVADLNGLAETYDTLRFVQVSARRLVELATLPRGAQVLDIATGTGWAALAAAQYVGPTGRVLGVDLAPDLLVSSRQYDRQPQGGQHHVHTSRMCQSHPDRVRTAEAVPYCLATGRLD